MEPGNPILVERLFNDISANYDKLNDIFSFGLHRLWKKKLIALLDPKSNEDWIDICCGTGDVAFLLARHVLPNGKILGIDSADKPLDLAKKKSREYLSLPLSWSKRNALQTELPDCSFDGAVMAYGLRNLTDPLQGLQEIKRILKPKGRAGILDFNKNSPGSLGAKFQHFYLTKITVPIAKKFGLGDHYKYLLESLKAFPDGNELEFMAREAGFKESNYHAIAFGQMGILLLEN